MSRPTDDAGVDAEPTVSMSEGDSLQARMRAFVADNGADIDLKAARQVDAEGDDLSTVVIDSRDERV